VERSLHLLLVFTRRRTGEGLINGYPIGLGKKGQLLVRIDPNWDYDRQRLIPAELEDQVNENLERQFKATARKIFDFFTKSKVDLPLQLAFLWARGPRIPSSM